jgi:hypothetical protein
MSINTELAAWGEPPLTPEEEERLRQLGPLLEALEGGDFPPEGAAEPRLVRLLRRLQQSTSLLQTESGLLGHNPDEGSPAVGVPAAAVPDPFPGEFRLLQRLGGGGYGTVWLAEDIKLGGRRVALKTLRVAGDPDRLTALCREATILGGLEEHRNLVRVHSWRESGSEVWLVLQYVAGGSLEDRLARQGPLAWQDAARYVADVAEGLVHAHAAAVVHRDIKPANILWDEARDEALLTDFGAAARGDDGAVAGTPWYMAPEAFERGPVSPKRDVYSLAATLFRLLTGECPFPGPTTAELQAQARQGLAVDDPRFADVPEPLAEVIRAGLTGDPVGRPELDEFRAALRGALNRLLSDELGAVSASWLHLLVEREVGGRFTLAATTRRAAVRRTRNMGKRVPPVPEEQVRLRTGDVVRVVVESERTGYVTVFNVGPTGDLTVLYPEQPAGPGSGPTVEAGQPLKVPEVEMQPPAGRERLFAVWTARPLVLDEERLRAVATGKEAPLSPAYRATRNMGRVKQAVVRLRPEEWAVAVLEVDHGE